MYTFEHDSVNHLFINILRKIKSEGKEISKNGKKITEIYPVIIRVKNPKGGIFCIKNRGYNPAFSVAETLWNLTAQTDDWLIRYNPKYNDYFTEGKLLAGYGNRIFNWKGKTNQLDKVVNMLRTRPESQHANIVVSDPSVDLDSPKFVPCISLIKFKIRENKLEMTTLMRAQDIWLGFPYDIHLLLSLFQVVSLLLNVEMGDYYHYCDVVRLYEADYEKSEHVALMDTRLPSDIEMELPRESVFEKLKTYKDIIKDVPNDYLARIADEPEYWRNSLKVCYAYILIHQHRYEESCRVIDSITNIYRTQFLDWLRHYHSKGFEACCAESFCEDSPKLRSAHVLTTT